MKERPSAHKTAKGEDIDGNRFDIQNVERINLQKIGYRSSEN